MSRQSDDPRQTADWPIPTADAYGGVLLTRHGEILLREPSGHFGGYVWTFAKGRPRPGDTPQQTALREVEEETGYPVEVIDVLPGVYRTSYSSSAFFVMRHLWPPGPHDHETRQVRWVRFERARELIERTPNEQGRKRDLAILAAAVEWFVANQALVLLPERHGPGPDAAVDIDWDKRHPLPKKRTTLQLDFWIDRAAAERVQRGFIPQVMEDRWFAWFDPERLVLHQHRSWTGYQIDRVHFVWEGGGLRAVRAEVNRDPSQYGNTDDAEDRARIEQMVRSLAQHDPDVPVVDSMVLALQATMQPGYLGRPQVVERLLLPYIERVAAGAAPGAASRRAADADTKADADAEPLPAMVDRITSVFCEDQPGHTRMPGWHIRQALGEELIRAFELDASRLADASLADVVRAALHALAHAIDMVSEDDDAELRVARISQFAIAAFLGTAEVVFPGRTLGQID